jgi:hypothetical protein
LHPCLQTIAAGFMLFSRPKMIIAHCAGVSSCQRECLLARVWEGETFIVSNVGKTCLRLASEYIGTCNGCDMVHVQFGAVVVKLSYCGCDGVAGFGDPKCVARLLAPHCTNNTILSKTFQQTTFGQRVGTSDTLPRLPASASFLSQTRPRTVLPNSGAERRPKSTCVMSCKRSHTFKIHVPQHQVQRSHFRSRVTRAALLVPDACTIAKKPPLTAKCHPMFPFSRDACAPCSTFNFPASRSSVSTLYDVNDGSCTALHVISIEAHMQH